MNELSIVTLLNFMQSFSIINITWLWECLSPIVINIFLELRKLTPHDSVEYTNPRYGSVM
jgi:hypothetical protein